MRVNCGMTRAFSLTAGGHGHGTSSSATDDQSARTPWRLSWSAGLAKPTPLIRLEHGRSCHEIDSPDDSRAAGPPVVARSHIRFTPAATLALVTGVRTTPAASWRVVVLPQLRPREPRRAVRRRYGRVTRISRSVAFGSNAGDARQSRRLVA